MYLKHVDPKVCYRFSKLSPKTFNSLLQKINIGDPWLGFCTLWRIYTKKSKNSGLISIIIYLNMQNLKLAP